MTSLPKESLATASDSPIDFESLPKLTRDRAFWGMTVTQLLGVFNDSVYKQVVLLLCVSVIVTKGQPVDDQQFYGQGAFALSFLLFSGIAGYWSDRASKRTIIIACKMAEIVVMLAATYVFMTMVAPVATEKLLEFDGKEIKNTVYPVQGTPWLLLGVLFLMGMQSAVFGPAKYGILPEMLRPGDLPRVNGVLQMTTFLALIFGMLGGGMLLDAYHDQLWKAGMACVAIAIVGTATSFAVRRTPVAQKDAPFRWSSIFAGEETWKVLRNDRSLALALAVYSCFWFVVAILPMMVNWLGLYQFHLSYTDTSFLLASSSVGIAIGFALAGWLSSTHIRFGLVRLGAIGLIVCLVLMSLPVSSLAGEGTDPAEIWPHYMGYRGSQIVLVFMGFFAGIFALPVQVYLQSKPPKEMKGRVIGFMNLINWIGILLAAMFYFAVEGVLKDWELPKYFTFGLAAVVLFPIAIFYRPKDVDL